MQVAHTYVYTFVQTHMIIQIYEHIYSSLAKSSQTARMIASLAVRGHEGHDANIGCCIQTNAQGGQGEGGA